ncbi:porin [Corynebacterium hylobatis]|uniref:Porin n=1 Tax=Corynebacterium hylobatis TaxID=1859290 RepID=A0A430I0K2_9CORY|nr:porin [Corynebacterium hylobatis]RSZ65126.1 porin [Corynebacterium hylobatis]
MDFSSNVIASSEAWANLSSTGVFGELFRILKETADWLDALNKLDGLSSKMAGDD